MSYRNINLSLLIILCVYSFIFLVFPEFDIWTSKYFMNLYKYEFCSKLTGPIKKFIIVSILAVAIVKLVLAGVAYYFKRRNQINFFAKLYSDFLRSSAFLFFNVTIIGGLMVETIKLIFSRIRPDDTTNFGGKGIYETVFHVNRICQSNCSFPSGDAAVGFLVFPLLLALTRKPLLSFIIGAASGILFSYCRISAGRHFLSDVIFSGIIVCYFASVSYLYLMKYNSVR